MKKLVIAGALLATLGLAGCQTTGPDRVLGGALIGAGSGAAIGAAAGHTPGAALAGGIIGGVAGGLIASATDPGRCYVRNRYGERVRVRCR
jgi:hypothetical protein